MINFNEDLIITFCGKSAYEKGKKCVNANHDFTKLFRQDNCLFGLYQGSVGIYRINLIFENDAPSYAWCTCPSMSSGWDNTCKHVAGMMILWHRKRAEFVTLKSWQSLLANKNSASIIKLIEKSSQKSIETVNALYEEVSGELLIEDYELSSNETY